MNAFFAQFFAKFSAKGAAKPTRRRRAGFTLIEVMVVVVILSILATLVLPNFFDRPDRARIVKAKQDIRAIVSVVNLYRLDNIDYPSSLGDVANYFQNKQVPVDPWGNAYQYSYPGSRGDFDVYSYGRDGSEGGADLDADIGSWNLDS